MSGIVGIVNRDGAPVDRDLLQRMADSLAYRGPDRTGIWVDGHVGFGHTLLATTHEHQREEQPCTLDGQTWIVADARIDDRDRLKRELLAHGRSAVDVATDVELILHAYHVWGEDCVQHLLGDFSFAIWDGREQMLFCARDHIGIRPFVYYQTDKLFVFASEVKAVVPHFHVRINEGRIADYLVIELEGIDKTSTFYEDVFRLPPATCMLVQPEKTSSRVYWSLDTTTEAHYDSDHEYAGAFYEILEKAVVDRLRDPSNVGAMLSGGMDSSSIVAIARNWLADHGHAPLRTFSAIADDEDSDTETRFIKAVLQQGNTQSFTIKPAALDSIRAEIEKLLWHTQDIFDHNIFVPQIMYILAGKHNVRALLTGADGDLVVSAHLYFLSYLLRCGRWKTAWSEAVSLSSFYGRFNKSPWHFLYRFGRAGLIPGVVQKLWDSYRQGTRLQNTIERTIISDDFAARIDLAGRFHQFAQWDTPALPHTLNQLDARSISHPNIAAALERYDRVAALYAIEPRHPFLDKRLVEFCVTLPREQKTSNGWPKIVLRHAMAGLLPDDVRWRRGWEHLGPQFSEAWFRLQRDRMERIISSNSHKSSGATEHAGSAPDGLQQYVRFDKLNDEYGMWKAITLNTWLQSVGS